MAMDDAPHPVGVPGSTRNGSRGLVLATLCFVYVLNFLDRQLVSILAKPIQDGLGITDSQLGTTPRWGPVTGNGSGKMGPTTNGDSWRSRSPT